MMEGAEKYHREIEPEGESSVAQLLRWIREGSKVLEMGPATGIMTKFLSHNKKCEVTCVEVDPQAAQAAKPFCARMIIGDLNRTEWASEINEQLFDYIIFADVLEHLLNPVESLSFALNFLKPDGEVLVSVPNIGYVGVIEELLRGRFDYRRDGLLDETHVHFFTRHSLTQLLAQTGLVAREWSRTAVKPEFSEFKLQVDKLGSATRGLLSSVPDGDTYQFLARCSKTGVAVAHEVPPGREYGSTGLTAQVYFDMGRGFSEEGSLTLRLEEHHELQTIAFKCPAGLKAIRFDPVDGMVAVTLHAISVTEGEKALFSWSPDKATLAASAGLMNAVEVHDSNASVLIPQSIDPGISILVDSDREALCEVHLSLDAPRVIAEVLNSFKPFREQYGNLEKHAQGLESRALALEKLTIDLKSQLRDAESLRQQTQLSLEQTESRANDLKRSLEATEHRLHEYHLALVSGQDRIRQLEELVKGIVRSNSWKITRPLRVGSRLVKLVSRILGFLMKSSLRRVILLIRPVTPIGLCLNLWRRFSLGSDYDLTLARVEPTARELNRMRKQSSKIIGTTFSIIMPTYKSNARWLKMAIESVRKQAYPYWELCIADDASESPAVRSLLSTYAQNDPRIKVKFLSQNGHISRASNEALKLVTGDYVVLLDHDDLLAPQALYRLAEVVKADRRVDVIYSDEDKLSGDGVRSEPTCKPDWSPEYFLSFMYTGHISCFRSSLVRDVGGFREGFEGSQDYDLMLRVTERTDRVVHVPEVLYHWRAHGESVAGNLDSKPYAFQAAKGAIAEALRRRGFSNARVADSRARGLYVVERGEKADLVEVINISTTDSPEAITGMRAVRFSPENEPEIIRHLLSTTAEKAGVVAIAFGATFTDSVMGRLLDHLSDQALGVAGPLIVDDRGVVIAAGMCVDRGRLRSNFEGLSAKDVGYRGRLIVPFNVSATHPACVVFRTTLLQDVPRSVKSVSELIFSVCLAARRGNLRCLVDPSIHAVVGEGDFKFDVREERVESLLTEFGVTGMRDPYLPAGLPRYANCTEMPAA